MAIRGDVTVECDQKDCQAELIISGVQLWDSRLFTLVDYEGWKIRAGKFVCDACDEKGPSRAW